MQPVTKNNINNPVYGESYTGADINWVAVQSSSENEVGKITSQPYRDLCINSVLSGCSVWLSETYVIEASYIGKNRS